ncbi:MAG: hypothetical protein OHK0029_13260 [Armatimonadaceae bacterium]
MNFAKTFLNRFSQPRTFWTIFSVMVSFVLLAGCGASFGGGDDDDDGNGNGYIIGPITNRPGFDTIPTRQQIIGTWRTESILFPPNRDFPQVGSISCPGGSGNESCGPNDLVIINSDGSLILQEDGNTENGTFTYNADGTFQFRIGNESQSGTIRLNAGTDRLQVITDNGNSGRILAPATVTAP